MGKRMPHFLGIICHQQVDHGVLAGSLFDKHCVRFDRCTGRRVALRVWLKRLQVCKLGHFGVAIAL